MTRYYAWTPCKHGRYEPHNWGECPGGSPSEEGEIVRLQCGLCGALWRPDHMKDCPVASEAHPEDFCEECGSENVSWVVPSDRFNLAMQAIGRDRGAIVCPVCFVKAHRKATGLTATWELVPATPFRPIPEGITLEEFAQRAVKIAEAWRIDTNEGTE